MTTNQISVAELLEKLVVHLSDNSPLDAELYDTISQRPEYGIEVMKLLPELSLADNATHADSEANGDNEDASGFSVKLLACLHYIEICLVHIKLAQEHYQRFADELLEKYENTLLHLIDQYPESTCWLALINLFFDAELPIRDDIKELYIDVIEQHQSHEANHAQQAAVEQLLADSSEASDFEIAELFLSQTNALPRDYFPSFLRELLNFNLPKATNAAVLFLLHPVLDIRNTIIQAADLIFKDVVLPAQSMSRLLMIRHWLPDVEKGAVGSLINQQRKKNASFADLRHAEIKEIRATEMDGTGAQAIFMLIKRKKGYQAAGLLVKRYFGIKDTWLGPIMSKKDAKSYAQDSLYGDFFLRKVDRAYLDLLVADHIHQAQKIDSVPHITLLELQEITGCQWQAQGLAINKTIQHLLAEYPEIDEDFKVASLERSGNWYKKYDFTESWYDENPELDRLVNQFCTYRDGVKQCNVSKAMPVVISDYFEPRREPWLEHFLWLTLWAKPAAKHNELLWKDALVLTNELYNNQPMADIPLIRVIAEQSILQSVETMETRKTHLGSVSLD